MNFLREIFSYWWLWMPGYSLVFIGAGISPLSWNGLVIFGGCLFLTVGARLETIDEYNLNK